MNKLTFTVEQVQGEAWSYDNFGYGGLVESFGYDILLNERIGDYQGDRLFLLRDGERVGFLVQGYGSCSYCDALEACDSVQDILDLRQRMFDSVRWFDSAAQARAWFIENENNDWYSHESEWAEFRTKALDVLS